MNFYHNSYLVGVFDATHDNAVFIADGIMTWYCASLGQEKTLTCVDTCAFGSKKVAILEQGDDIRIVLVCSVYTDSVWFTEVIYIDPRADALVSRKPFPSEGCQYKIGTGQLAMVKSAYGTALFVGEKCGSVKPDCKPDCLMGTHPSFTIFEATFDDFVVRVLDSTFALNAPVGDNRHQTIKSIDLVGNRAIVWVSCRGVGGVFETQIHKTADAVVPATEHRVPRDHNLLAIDPESGCCVWVPRGRVDPYKYTILDVTPTVSYEHTETFDVGVPLYTTSRNAVFIRGRLWFTTFDKTTNIIRYRDFDFGADTKPCV